VNACRSWRVSFVLPIFLLPTPAQAMRIIGITISLDSKPYMSGTSADNGSRKPHHVWRDLSAASLKPGNGVSVKPDQEGGAVATLRGHIHIAVRYGAEADVTELRLVRAKRDPSAWSVDSDDVERIAKSIGLPEVSEEDIKIAAQKGGDDDFKPDGRIIKTPPPDTYSWQLWAITIAVLVAISAAVVYFLWIRSNKD
jgi:hypothetical protein